MAGLKPETGPRAGSSLSGERTGRQEPSQSHSHCQAEPTKAAQRRILLRARHISHNVYYVQSRLGIDSATEPDQWHPGHHPGPNPSHSFSALMVAGDPEASRHVQATHVRSNSRTLQSPPVRRTSQDQRSILRETQALSPAEFNADRPAATVTRHVNDARQPVNCAALERLVIGTVLDQGVDAGISPAEHALNLSSARCPRAPCRRDSKIIRRNRLLRCTRAVQIPTQTSNFSYFHSRKSLKNRTFSMLDATAAPE